MSLAKQSEERPLQAADAAFRYHAYGLEISSELALPELEPGNPDLPADVTIRLRPTGRAAPASLEYNIFEFAEDEQFLAWPLVGGFLIRGLDTIDIERTPGVADNLLPFPLLGPVMGILLHLRGFLLLHSSAVAIGKGCAVFLGDKRAGKSTTAAAFARAGHRLITDDLLAIDTANPQVVEIAPAFPQIKLSADAEEAVRIEGASALPLVLPDFEKRQQRLTGFSHERVRPSGVYVLVRGETARVTRLPAAEALAAVIQFSYVTRFETRRLQGEEAHRHLRQCVALVNAAPVYRLEVPTGLERLPEVVALLEAEIG